MKHTDQFNLMVIEDNKEVIESIKFAIERYMDSKSKKINLDEQNSYEAAIKVLDNKYDGIIIDLKLSDKENGGNLIVEEIHRKFRIPIAVYTGLPGNINREEVPYCKIYIKAENTPEEIFDYFFSIYDTGITRIMGGRGQLEDAMNQIFWSNIIDTLDVWKDYVSKGINPEKSLLRYVLTHLYEFLGDDDEKYFPEEMYIFPPISKNIRTGSIVKKKDGVDFYIVLSPACDLAIHDGEIKTNRIMVCLIENSDTLIIRNNVKKIIRNTHCPYYHYLPSVKNFIGGIINFRNLTTFEKNDFKDKFSEPVIQISAPFIKDIVSRFSTYYARQGQPDFDFEKLASKLLEKL